MPDSAAVPDAPVAFHPASSLDYLPRETLRGLQSERLRRAVAAAYGLTEPARLRAEAPDLIIQRCDELIVRCRILPGGALPGGRGEESR